MSRFRSARPRTLSSCAAVTPAAELGHALADARRAGDPFDTAWPVAVAIAVDTLQGKEHEGCTVALHSTRDAWLSAWERRPATNAQRALVAVTASPPTTAAPAATNR